MFGHQDDQPAQKTESETYQAGEAADSGAVGTDQSQAQPSDQTMPPVQDGSDASDNGSQDASAPSDAPDAPDAPSLTTGITDSAGKNQDQAWQHPGKPLDMNATDIGDKPEDMPQQEPIKDIISPAGGYPKRPSYQYGSGNDPDDSDPLKALDPKIRELFTIKEEALDELAPLIDKLDLPPEEKFPALMMIIQTSDDQRLIEAAYNTAHAIKDDKIRARALLDIVNEINYFTAPQDDQPK